jgi:hypothetical protein
MRLKLGRSAGDLVLGWRILLSMRLKTGSILSQDVIYCRYLLVRAVFNLIEVKNWLSLVVSVVGWCILYVK